MKANRYQPPEHEEPALDWSPLRLYRWMILSGVGLWITRAFFDDGSLRTIFLWGGIAAIAIGLSQGMSFLCPGCSHKFVRFRLGANFIIGLMNIPVQAFKLLTRQTCESCGAEVNATKR